MLLGQELKFKNKLCNLKWGTFFSAFPWARSFCPLPFRFAPVTVGSGRVGKNVSADYQRLFGGNEWYGVTK